MVAPSVNKLVRYLPPAFGQIAAAGAQFLLSLQLLHVLPPAQFGTFSFILIAVQFGFGLSNAVLCAPYPLELGHDRTDGSARTTTLFMSGNLAFSLTGAALMAALGLGFALSATEVALLFGYSAIMLLRWFARSHAYASARPGRAATSDIVYGCTLLAGIALARGSEAFGLGHALALLLVSAVLSLLPFGGSYLLLQFLRVSPAALAGYGAVWRRHARWALLGVMMTEATANAHAYAVIVLIGPAGLAPIAAAQLMIRPITLIMNALSNFERPPLARAVAAGQIDAALDRVRGFRLAMVGIYAATLVAAAALMLTAPRAVFPEPYAAADVGVGVALWFAIAAITLVRAPESILLQAAGRLRDLAFAGIASCAASIAAVLLLLLVAPPVWSLAGILLGQAILALHTWRLAAQWRRAHAASAQPEGNDI